MQSARKKLNWLLEEDDIIQNLYNYAFTTSSIQFGAGGEGSLIKKPVDMTENQWMGRGPTRQQKQKRQKQL